MNDFLDDLIAPPSAASLEALAFGLRDEIRGLRHENDLLAVEAEAARGLIDDLRKLAGEYRVHEGPRGIVAAFRDCLESALAGAKSSAEAIARAKRAERVAGAEAHGWSLSAARLKVERDEAREKLEAVRAILAD